jgi:hypothetical protein
MFRTVRALGWSAIAIAVIGAAACGDEPATADRYCQAIGDNLTALNAPTIITVDDITRTVDLYASLRDLAPAAVAPEWAALTEAVSAAAEVDPNDPTALQAAADGIRAAEPAAQAIASYTTTTCGHNLLIASNL